MQWPRNAPLMLVALLAVGALSLAAGCGFVSGSGDLVTRALDLADFSRVEVGSSFDVRVTQGDNFAVTVTLDDNIVQYLEAEVDGDGLHLGLQPGNSYNDVTLEAKVVLPELEVLELGGATNGRLSGFNDLESLKVALNGDSSLTVQDLRSSEADVELNGSSDLQGTWVMTGAGFDLTGDSEVRLTGAADDLVLTASGSSTSELARFRVARLSAEFSGSSDGTIHVTGTLDANLSGASTLEYLGDPTLGNIETSGNSEVRPADQ